MSFLQRYSRSQLIFFALVTLAIACGIGLRVYNLRGSGFFFYDEGLYLNHNRAILEYIQSRPLSSADCLKAFSYYARLALGSGKSLWFFIVDSRFFWGGLTDWDFSKVMACVFGLLTLPVFFIIVRRYYNSNSIALLAVALLALLPGHVFYSRIGLQEAFSTFLVLSGFYFYLFPRKFGWRTVVAALLLAAAFFANYRLAMLPVLVALTEFWIGIVEKKGVGWRKVSWFSVTFFACMVLVGNLFHGANTVMIAAWIFHQGDTAKEVFSWVNFFSYPYYLFRLESGILTLFFFCNIYCVINKRWAVLLPAVLFVAQMVIFSTTNEKAIRYIAVVMPFFVMSAAFAIKSLYDVLSEKKRIALAIVLGVMVFLMCGKSAQIAQASSAYESAARYLIEKSPDARIIAPQDQVMGLYVNPRERIKPVPVSFDVLLKLYSQGYHYLVLGPQSYVDCASGGRFVLPLRDYLGFIDSKVEPVKVYPHLNQAVMERFVFEHSTNLVDSIRFLGSDELVQLSSLRIYDLSRIVPAMTRIVEELKKK